MGISKNAPFPLRWRGIKGEAKQIIRVFRDALIKLTLKKIHPNVGMTEQKTKNVLPTYLFRP